MANVSRSVGHDLLNVPFPEMITKMALAIAEGQMALDMNSIDVAQALANTTLPAGTVIVAIKETVDANGNVTGTSVDYNDADMPLLVYGLNPTFYEFTESIIEVKMSITMRTERSMEREFGSKFSLTSKTDIKTNFSAGGGFLSSLFGTPKVKTEVKNTTTVAYTSTYNATYSQKYSYQAEGTSLLRTTLRPVPPPDRAIPVITVEESSGGP